MKILSLSILVAIGMLATNLEAGCVNGGYKSTEQEYAPVQITGQGLPNGYMNIEWQRPSIHISLGSFSGRPGKKASHEGVDYIHARSSVKTVNLYSVADGRVAYIRYGCPQSSMFSHNNYKRECGSGWGNHVIIEHAYGIYTRYGHMFTIKSDIRMGDAVRKGDYIGTMGNTGRSELRHLHFELGTGILNGASFSCNKPTRSFNRVYNSQRLPYGSPASDNRICKVYSSTDGLVNVRGGASTRYDVIDTLSNNDQVKVVGYSGNWYKVTYDDVTGYIYSGLVNCN